MTQDNETRTDTTLYIIERMDRTAKVSCTIGKITINLRTDVDRDILAHILLSLSKVDSNIFYEYEAVCQYTDINQYRLDDYIVVSYSKSGKGYKTIFNVPFSRRKAIRRLAINLLDRVKAADTDISLLWDGNVSKVNQLYEELGAGKDWRFQVIGAS